LRKSVRQQHGDPVRYVACVLWLIGYSERAIATVLSLRTKQVAGLISRSEYAGRSFMSDEQRTEMLKELESIRMEGGVPIDGGLLDRVPFSILHLGAASRPGPMRRRLG
jgi:hypothetical protein